MAQGRQSSRLEEFFRAADKDNSGSLSRLELAKIVQSCGYEYPADVIAAWFDEIDKDKSGSIDMNEFITYMNQLSSEKIEEADLRATFKVMDTDGSGQLSKAEIAKCLADIGTSVSDEKLEEMIKSVDTNNDGQLNIEEFIKAFNEGK